MITVSTLIPVYNGAKYIRNAVSSALNQRGVGVEVVVIDDGSTDETPALLKDFGDSIRVIQQANSGHVRSRNNGAKIASGQWLAFLDADDEWHPDKLVKQLDCVDDTIGMVYTDRQNFGDLSRVDEIQSQSVKHFEGDLFEPLLFGNFVTVSSVIMRIDWFQRLRGFDEELLVCEDWDLWLRFAAAGGMAAVSREPLTRYRWDTSSMTYNQQRMCTGRLKVVNRALASDRGQLVPVTVARRALANAWKTSAWYATPTQRWRALSWYLNSILHWPFDIAVYKGMVKCCLGLS